MKNALHALIVVVTGSLLGTFVGKLAEIWAPGGRAVSLLNTGIDTGLAPATLDLTIIELTFGLIFKFNVAALLGIFIAAVVYKQLIK
ncbi:MAG TPA: DUF4321 domain-containing protein [Elusimicrobiales bacterium]|nr:DUF4321 domain-containing protein [Elusimicrobiales bacterium]